MTINPDQAPQPAEFRLVPATPRTGFALAVAAVALWLTAPIAASAADYRIGDCVGPIMTSIESRTWQEGGDVRHGAQPPIMTGPGPSARPTGRKLEAGGAYIVASVSGRDFQLTATKYSSPFAPGSLVGWFRPEGFHGLALRNCN